MLCWRIAPFDKRGDVSFILDKNKVDTAQERMRVEAARYTGTDDKGQKFAIIADRAIQPTSDRPIVDIMGMRAQLDLERGPLTIVAHKGRYNLDQQKVAIDGPVRVAGPDGYRLETRDVGDRPQESPPCQPRPRRRRYAAGALRSGADDRRPRHARSGADDGVRLKFVQGAVR